MEVNNLNNLPQENLDDWNNRFHQIYYQIASIGTSEKDKQKIGSKDNQVCSYCGKNKEQTSFKKTAHVLPKALGNIYLTTFKECDECNEKFGRYENDLCNFIGLVRYMQNPEDIGKKRQLVYRKHNSSSFLYTSKRGIEFRDFEDRIFDISEDKKIFKSKVNKNPYIPLNIYKSLAKAFLSTLTDDSLNNFRKTIDFLLTDEYDNKKIKEICKLSYHWLNDFHLGTPWLRIFHKRNDVTLDCDNDITLIAEVTIILYTYSYAYQIFIVSDESFSKFLDGDYKKILFAFHAPCVNLYNENQALFFNNYHHYFKDLSSLEKVIDEKDELCIKALVQPILLEYTDEEHQTLKEKYNLRD